MESEWYDITDFWPPPNVTVLAVVGDINHKESKKMVKLAYDLDYEDKIFKETATDEMVANGREVFYPDSEKEYYMIAWKHLHKRGTYHAKENPE